MEFITEDYGRGTAWIGDKQLICFGCKSLDHLTGLCPFTSLSGWLGPAPQSVTTDEHNMVERDRGCPRKSGKRGITLPIVTHNLFTKTFHVTSTVHGFGLKDGHLTQKTPSRGHTVHSACAIKAMSSTLLSALITYFLPFKSDCVT
ncbi:hypothetical protein EDD17DRAFT_1514923 [Pisolithus thermaeus]|nr:hypothetical protein EV401DRAFT_1885128 [Pisolithus croceorrhizus]KAI6145322.1 hypothetical protein EDD17DRAFT_1514923 [Pisolithus thermaeus]